MKAEDFIDLIEQKRYDKISKNGMDLIAKRFREIEKEKIVYRYIDTNCKPN
jgi:hypothetical protein